MLAEKDEYIESAYQRLKVISQDEKMRREYEVCQKAILDYNQGIKEARQEGIALRNIEIAKEIAASGFETDQLPIDQIESLCADV